MKRFHLIYSFFALILFSQCAKQSSPLGGPRDEEPPVLLESNPIDQSLNTSPKEIRLTFDEYIKLDNPNKNIIITPRLNKDEIITSSLKNQVIIELNQDLEENTTYVFNFQNSVQDLSEGNPAENLKLVFSTGNFIDSLKLSGKVNNYFPSQQNDVKNVIIGLYLESDTTDLFTAAPYYLTRPDSLGNFLIQNIKEGNYRAYAWLDANNSTKAEFKSESYDFLLDTLTISSDIDNIQFNLSPSDLTDFRLTRSSVANGSYDFVLNKNQVAEELEISGLGTEKFYTVEDKRIRLFSTISHTDSLLVHLSLEDSVANKIDTTIWAKFPESERRPEELILTANSGKNFTDTLKANLTFNKPILKVNTDSLFIPVDSSFTIQIQENMFSFKDSLKRTELEFRIPITDTLGIEIFTLTALDSTFQDVQGQYNEDPLRANYRQIKKETLADLVSGTVTNATPPFVIQLIDAKNVIYRESYLEKETNFAFSGIEAGSYKIRVIEDTNGNRRWDPSNFFEGRQAERIFYFLDDTGAIGSIILKSGWTNEGIIISGSPKSGKLE
ncbi:MAG: Ig-like domain-containing protein [Algoriphagus sp.]|uniref:Ig-like domain-containing domain n=1 Tax=Algoriphagus sp. TaxID=1872435 RepID=UPI0017969D44|nr:Ig-like domain-containing domain [Algoriphagus sp.]NVJ87505.1 Ig-like domain-containing protein [Algoriphagus sp.]